MDLGKSLVIKGELSGSEDLTLCGHMEGSIKLSAHTLTIGSQADIKAEISAKTVVIIGAVTGNVTAGEKVEIQATGSVSGDVMSPRLVIADGGELCGKVQIPKPKRGQTAQQSGEDGPGCLTSELRGVHSQAKGAKSTGPRKFTVTASADVIGADTRPKLSPVATRIATMRGRRLLQRQRGSLVCGGPERCFASSSKRRTGRNDSESDQEHDANEEQHVVPPRMSEHIHPSANPSPRFGGDSHLRMKVSSIEMRTATGFPFFLPGVNTHCRAAFIASLSSPNCVSRDLTTFVSPTVPSGNTTTGSDEHGPRDQNSDGQVHVTLPLSQE